MRGQGGRELAAIPRTGRERPLVRARPAADLERARTRLLENRDPRARLGFAGGIEVDVELPLIAPLGIPGGFTMADQANVGRRHANSPAD